MKDIVKRFLIFVPIAVGAFIAWLMVSNAKAPEEKPVEERVRSLRVLTIAPTTVVPQARGYGSARPAREWQAVAEVSGRLVYRHPDLRPGNSFAANVEILRIDSTSYDLAVARLNAEIAQIDAQLAELERREENDKATLAIESRSLAVAKTSLERDRDLAKRNAVATTQVEAQEREVLAQESRIQATKNSLALLPAERKRLTAQRAVAAANLKQAENDVKKTVIRTPFRCDVGELNVEQGQYVAVGQSMVACNDIMQAEVEASIPMTQLGRLIPVEIRDQISFDETVIQTAAKLGIQSYVYVVGARTDFEPWEARLVRVRERVEERTRSLGFVVAVDDPLSKAKPGERPILTRGIFCELVLRSRPQPNRIIVPRSAVRAGTSVFVVVDGRLQKRDVGLEFAQDDFAVVKSGLQAGDVVIVSDPTPAILGMRVDPIEDKELAAALQEQAGNPRR